MLYEQTASCPQQTVVSTDTVIWIFLKRNIHKDVTFNSTGHLMVSLLLSGPVLH